MLCQREEPENLDLLENCILEPKYDGSRNLFFIDFEHNYFRIQHRSLADYTEKYPEFNLEELRKIFNKNCKSIILDGELIAKDFEVVLSRNNLSDIQKIQMSSKLNPVKFIAFDCLMINNQDIRFLPLQHRKYCLSKAIEKKNNLIEVIQFWEEDFSTRYQELVDWGFEGVVCKDKSSEYLSKRTSFWLKIKPLQIDEFKVIGYNEKSGRSSYGSMKTDRGDVGLLTWANLEEFNKLLDEVGLERIWVEVEYQKLNPSGKARFPIFRRFVVKPSEKYQSLTSEENEDVEDLKIGV